jgi:hypothetical protein
MVAEGRKAGTEPGLQADSFCTMALAARNAAGAIPFLNGTQSFSFHGQKIINRL